MLDVFDDQLRAGVLADATMLREILAQILQLAERPDRGEPLLEIVRLVRMALRPADLRDAEDAKSAEV